MSDPGILSVSTVVPENVCLLEEVAFQAQAWVEKQEKGFKAKVDRLFRRAGVNRRYTVLPLKKLFEPMTLTEKNNIYRNHIVDYAETALREALNQAGIEASMLDCLIVTSCTGHMSPSLDAFLVNRLALKPSIQRLPVMEMGCIGGVSALMYAENYCRAYPGSHVAVIAAELTSITFQRDDYSWANIISTAIFGDGIACAILSSCPAEKKAAIRSSGMYHYPNSTHLLGFDLSSTGFTMQLDSNLPTVIGEQFSTVLEKALHPVGWSFDDLHEFMIHPGGLKILKELESLMGPMRNTRFEDPPFQLSASRKILQDYGNMSSATVLFLLKQWLDSGAPKKRGLLAAFGPGLTAGTILVEQ
ncbi:type III polyketide synthase [Vampirovibrio sp.]|uniref:type III polyketide synthase n=1 Tax=Vampirovibrio sp. TaxID=2717857 RepID=UPI0035933510